jgi:hypothetical protein
MAAIISVVLLPFQNVGYFCIFRFIVFGIYLHILYVYMHSKSYRPKKVKTNCILERRE